MQRAKATPVNQSPGRMPAGPAPAGPVPPAPAPDPDSVAARLTELLTDEDKQELAEIQMRAKACHRESQRKSFEGQTIAMEYDEKLEELQRRYKVY